MLQISGQDGRPFRNLEAQHIAFDDDVGNAVERVGDVGGPRRLVVVPESKKADKLIGIDFSEEMLARAKEKIKSGNVLFIQSDLTQEWKIEDDLADLITCSLVLEHIADLDFIFKQAFKKLKPGGRFYVCELHPFKQYNGTKARYETDSGTVELEVYIHHVSDFTDSALKNGFNILELKEWFDNGEKMTIPRLISFVFEKI